MTSNNTGDLRRLPQFLLKQNNDVVIIKYLMEKRVTENHTNRHYSFLNNKFNTFNPLKTGMLYTAFLKHDFLGHIFAYHTF